VAWLVSMNLMPHEALIRMLGGYAYPFGGYGTFVPQHKETPQNIDRIARKTAKVQVCRCFTRSVLSGSSTAIDAT
jgi:hypothetical protein